MTSSRLSNLGDTVDLVLDGFGTFGQADRGTDPWQADRQTVAQEVWALADEDLSSAGERAG